MRLLIYSKDGPWLSSAYGRIADELAGQRLSINHEIAIFATVGLSDGAVEINQGGRTIIVYPPLNRDDFTGQDIVERHIQDFKPDMFWTWGDVWPFMKVAQLASQRRFIWGVWAYVDFEWDGFYSSPLSNLLSASFVVPTSKWLERRLRAGLPSDVVKPTIGPGVNVENFKPLIGTKDEDGTDITKARLRRSVQFDEDAFVIGLVQMNQVERKPFEDQLKGVKMFVDANPDIKTTLYLHTLHAAQGGFDLPTLISELGLAERTRMADGYKWLKGILGYGDLGMCKLYNGMDVLLNATSGESPGMPILEAQACGVPVLATDFTAMPEYVGAGHMVKVRDTFRPPEHPKIIKALPDPASICENLERILNAGKESYSDKARTFALKHSWDKCAAEWQRTLSEIEHEIYRRTLTPPIPHGALKALSVQ